MGLDVVDDADVEAEEEGLEVKRVFDAAKEKHRKIMAGMYVIVVNSMHVGEVKDTLYKCNALNGTNVGEVEDTLYKCNALNGTNVGEVEDASMYVCMYVCTFSNSYRVTWPPVCGRGMDKIRGGVQGGGRGGAASAPSICQDHNNSTPHFHPHPHQNPHTGGTNGGGGDHRAEVEAHD